MEKKSGKSILNSNGFFHGGWCSCYELDTKHLFKQTLSATNLFYKVLGAYALLIHVHFFNLLKLLMAGNQLILGITGISGIIFGLHLMCINEELCSYHPVISPDSINVEKL
jgi:hypothetical protein